MSEEVFERFVPVIHRYESGGWFANCRRPSERVRGVGKFCFTRWGARRKARRLARRANEVRSAEFVSELELHW